MAVRTSLPVGCAAALALSPGVAHAKPALSLDRPCYSHAAALSVPYTYRGAGWPANSEVDVFEGSSATTHGTDASGAFVSRPGRVDADGVLAPKRMTLRAVSKLDPTLEAFASLNYVAFGVGVTGRAGSPFYARGRRFNFRFTGWPAGRPIYVHHRYMRLEGFRWGLVKTARIGTPKGPCGLLTRRMRRVAGVGKLKPGRWQEFFSNSRRPSSRAPYIKHSVTVNFVGEIGSAGQVDVKDPR